MGSFMGTQRAVDLWQKFQKEQGHIISLVGGGGKTTLMYALADYCARQGRRVLVSTTTHIYKPQAPYYAAGPEAVAACWQRGAFAVIGTPIGEKLAAPAADFLETMMERADVTLLEADGAKGFPCKAPAIWEPVIHPASDWVLGVFGMRAVGKPLRETCFRPEAAETLLGVEPGHILTAEDAAILLSSSQGARKNVGTREYCAVLNQCEGRETLAWAVASRLEELGVTRVGITAFENSRREAIRTIAEGGRKYGK